MFPLKARCYSLLRPLFIIVTALTRLPLNTYRATRLQSAEYPR